MFLLFPDSGYTTLRSPFRGLDNSVRFCRLQTGRGIQKTQWFSAISRPDNIYTPPSGYNHNFRVNSSADPIADIQRYIF